MSTQYAFPLPNGSETTVGSEGMTLRDYFAAKALQALAGGASWRDFDYLPKNGYSIVENNALLSYQMADAMLKARDEVKP